MRGTEAIRRTRRRLFGALLPAAAVAATLAGSLSASANNDTKRIYLPAGPVDLPAGYCAFPVHVDFPVDREYATVSTLSDGSTVLAVAGSLTVTATNELTGKSIEVNGSGPGTVTVSADGSTDIYDFSGRSVLIGTNQTAFGLPSNFVAAAGPVHIVQASGLGALSSLSGSPETITDVCAALS